MSSSVCCAPLNASLLCTRLMDFAILDNSTVQSSAESPPPNIKIFLSLYLSTDLTAYSTPFVRNLSGSSIFGGLLGSKDPAPAAIKIFFEKNSFS